MVKNTQENASQGMQFCPYCGVHLLAVGVCWIEEVNGTLEALESGKIRLCEVKKRRLASGFRCGACDSPLGRTGWV